MDGVKDESVYQRIFDAISKVDGVSNPHRVRSRSIGGKYMITLDVEADGGMTLNQAHALSNQIEQNIRDAAALPASRQDLAPPISLFRNGRESRKMLPLRRGLRDVY